MRVNTIIDVLGAIVTVALVTSIVAHPNSASVISALGGAFSGAVATAAGQPVAR